MTAIIRLKTRIEDKQAQIHECAEGQAEIRQFPCNHNRHLLMALSIVLAGLSLVVEFTLIGHQLSHDEVSRMNGSSIAVALPAKVAVTKVRVAPARTAVIGFQGKTKAL